MSTLLQQLSTFAKVLLQKYAEHKKLIVILTILYIIWTKLRPLMRVRHSLLLKRPPYSLPAISRFPLDPPDQSTIDTTLFPQLFLNRQGLRLNIRRWPTPKIKGIVFISHGMAEHVGRYEPIALMLNRLGYFVCGLDHQGHGQSEGDRVYAERFDDLAQDLADFISHEQASLERHVGRAPAFLIGHSMGGLIAVRMLLRSSNALRWPLTGVVLSGAAVAVDPSLANPVIRAVGTVLSYVFPKFPVTKLDCKDVSSIREVVESYRTDPLTGKGWIKCHFGLQILRAAEDSLRRAKEISLPLLLIHGTHDAIIPVEASRILAKTVSSTDVKLIEFSNSKHEVFNDIERKEAVGVVLQWIQQRTAPLPGVVHEGGNHGGIDLEVNGNIYVHPQSPMTPVESKE